MLSKATADDATTDDATTDEKSNLLCAMVNGNPVAVFDSGEPFGVRINQFLKEGVNKIYLSHKKGEIWKVSVIKSNILNPYEVIKSEEFSGDKTSFEMNVNPSVHWELPIFHSNIKDSDLNDGSICKFLSGLPSLDKANFYQVEICGVLLWSMKCYDSSSEDMKNIKKSYYEKLKGFFNQLESLHDGDLNIVKGKNLIYLYTSTEKIDGKECPYFMKMKDDSGGVIYLPPLTLYRRYDQWWLW
ncbi:hypothetical protein JIN85_07090 [Luteolibacter pohnpeiensis]|uniref:Uncharacterized protein n=1 Tax=Luteolibacter pohnpeiensis TaxID=454153 RepID=A0A934VU57_9BACT|nr:hypothetical protein [Luteolibacter pohnpeiensis]MBK1882172.1 hypothetical protein [Luteolibacter pohnpeiensis]